MKRGTQKREKKALSAKGLIEMVSGYFRDLRAPSHGGKGRPGEIGIDDCLRSALAMFGIKSPSLLSFNKSYENKVIVHNLSKLYLENEI